MSAKYLLAKHKDISVEFQEGGVFYNFFENEFECYKNKGLLDVLSIQLPKLNDRGFFSYAKHISRTEMVLISFIDSII